MQATDFLSIRDFSPGEIRHLLDLARDIKPHPAVYSAALRGKTLALIFEKPSLRTRVTFDVAPLPKLPRRMQTGPVFF